MVYVNTEVDLPQPLLDAQRSGKLVLFAGAGVSVGPPSNLPTFARLVGDIASGALTKEPDEPLDYFLGRLANAGVDVQARARRIIGDPESAPRKLHDDLIALFHTLAAPRIVTTNFDSHFLSCASRRFGADLDVYSAPALPLGHDFTGIVYLHGAVSRLRHPLVLTDRDFGRAYVTEGWASRFLVEMFREYTVLFVGYSHDDPIMRYLARGLAPGSSRFALSIAEGSAKWRHLGITAIEYPRREEPYTHEALDDAIAAWAAGSARGALEHAVLLKDILHGQPPADRPTDDYVASAFRDTVTLQFVVAHARSVEWLRWADDHKLLDTLFVRGADDSMETRILAGWFADHFAVGHSKEAMAIVRKHRLTMCHSLWTLLAMRLGSTDAAPPPAVMASWTVALLQAALPAWSREPLGPVLAACSRPEDVPTAMLLLAELTRPRLAVDDLHRVRIGGEIDLVGEPYHIAHGWAAALRPRLAVVAPMVEDIVSAQLGGAHQLLLAAGLASKDWDPASFRRSEIARHGSDEPEHTFDLLIDIARALLEWSLGEAYGMGQRIIGRWGSAEAPLLRRLALHGMALDQRLKPEKALELLQSRGWLYAATLKAEVFALIAQAYPRATRGARAALIADSMDAPVLMQPVDEGSGEEAARLRDIADYERYNLAVWLSQVAPECALAAEHLAALQASHPDFAPRPHPDLSSWSGGVRYGPGASLRTVEELLAADPASLVELFVTFTADRSSLDGPTRHGLLANMGEAAIRSFDWGWRLAGALVADLRVPDDVWQVLIGTWQDAPAGGDTDTTILAFFDAHPVIEKAAAGGVSSFLERRLDSMPSGVLPAAESLIDRLTSAAASETDEENLRSGDGLWLTAAINHSGGRVAQLWMRALGRRQTEAREAWTGLPTPYRRWFEDAVSSDEQWGAMARVVLASQLGFLYAIDREWSRVTMIPLFDWDLDPERAEQAWHGFAIWGQLSEPILADLMPHFRQSFRHLDRELERVCTDLSDRLVGVALYSSVDPIGSGWLEEFVSNGGEIARRAWTAGMGRELRSLDAAAAQSAWRRWIADYWERRLTGVPRPLVSTEGAEMVEWIYGLESVFSEVADKLCRSPIAVDGRRRVFARLVERHLAEAHPADLARIVDRLLLSIELPMYECDAVDALVRQLLSAAAPPEVLRRICESMLRVQCLSGVELAKLIPKRQ